MKCVMLSLFYTIKAEPNRCIVAVYVNIVLLCLEI